MDRERITSVGDSWVGLAGGVPGWWLVGLGGSFLLWAWIRGFSPAL